MEAYVELVFIGFGVGFAAALFSGLVSWGLTAICRLLINVIREGVKG